MTDRKEQTEGGRASYVGAPQIFELNAACVLINKAFRPQDAFGTYHVGSSLAKRDYRDVDVRTIMPDDAFVLMFGKVEPFQHIPLWNLLCVSISHWLSKRTDLPVDYQIQPQTWANTKYPKQARNPVGLFLSDENPA